MVATRSESKSGKSMVTNKSRSESKMVVAESMVMTRSRSKASMPVAESVVTTRPIHAWNWKTDIAETRKIIWGKKKPLKASYRSKFFINKVKVAALDNFVEKDEAVREFLENHKNDDPPALMVPVDLTYAAYKKWCSMTLIEQAPYLKKAAIKFQEEDEAEEKVRRKMFAQYLRLKNREDMRKKKGKRKRDGRE